MGMNFSAAETPLVERAFGERGNVVAIYGLQYGDEGKGKIVAAVQRAADVIVRAQGGGNAGHTVFYAGNKLALNHVPSGIVGDGKKAVLGQGMVINIHRVQEEIAGLEEAGRVMRGKEDLVLMGSAQFILPTLQGALDAALGGKIGTTGRGIGPAYSLKALRFPLTFNHMINEPEMAKDGIRELYEFLSDKAGINLDAAIKEFDEHRAILLSLIENKIIKFDRDNSFATESYWNGDKIALEGAQALLLDLNAGTYPNVTSSDTTPAGLISGSGVPQIHTGIGVTKTYLTRVGAGPMPSRLPDLDEEARLREALGEFGATTGRDRDLGYLDLVQLRYAMRRTQPDFLAITKLDEIRKFGKETRWVDAYSETSGERARYTHSLPQVFHFEGEGNRQYQGITPEYDRVVVPQDNIFEVSDFAGLGDGPQAYLREMLERMHFNGDAVFVGTGPKNESTVEIGVSRN